MSTPPTIARVRNPGIPFCSGSGVGDGVGSGVGTKVGDARAHIKMVDSGNFIRGSLYNISRDLSLSHKKETKPEWLGREPQGQKEWKDLIRYCRTEIKAEYALAQYILGIHETYDAGFTVSVAQLGSRAPA